MILTEPRPLLAVLDSIDIACQMTYDIRTDNCIRVARRAFYNIAEAGKWPLPMIYPTSGQGRVLYPAELQDLGRLLTWIQSRSSLESFHRRGRFDMLTAQQVVYVVSRRIMKVVYVDLVIPELSKPYRPARLVDGT